MKRLHTIQINNEGLNPIQNKKTLAYIGLCIVTIIIGLAFIFVKIGLQYTNSYDLLAHRFSVAFIVVLITWAIGIVKVPKIPTKDRILIVMISLFYPILFFGFQTLGMETASASQAGIIFALSPIFTLFAGALILKERTTAIQKLGVAISVASVIVVFLYKSDSNDISWIGILFLIASVLCIVGYYMIGKKLMQRYNSLSLTALMITISFITFNIIAIGRHYINNDMNTFFDPLKESSFIIAILYLGVLSSMLTSFLSNYALTFVTAYESSIFSNINPIITIIGAYFILHEQLNNFQLIGAAGVLLGVFLVLAHKKKNTNFNYSYKKY